MLILLCAFLIVAAALAVLASPSGHRVNGPTWFDLLPYMRPSKKASGRIQQKRKPRKRR